MSRSPTETRQPPSPPRAVAISGLIFAALYAASLVLIRLAIPADPTDPGTWLRDDTAGSGPERRHWVASTGHVDRHRRPSADVPQRCPVYPEYHDQRSRYAGPARTIMTTESGTTPLRRKPS